jgi:hypothetical protein
MVDKAYLRQMEIMLAKMKFVPTRVEYMAHLGAFEYIGMSPLFDAVDAGSLAPEYVLEVSKDKHGVIVSVHVSKV